LLAVITCLPFLIAITTNFFAKLVPPIIHICCLKQRWLVVFPFLNL
jgi:heme/copper-type cytochrome/quinol oxidase subunit 4